MSMFKTVAAAVVASTIAALAVTNVVSAGPGDEALSFHAITPDRAADTRGGTKVSLGGRSFSLAALVPPQASAVVLNITAVDPDGDGYLTAYPCNTTAPRTSNVNYVKGQIVPNSVTVAIESQRVCISSYVPSHVIVDVMGWYGPSGAVVLTTTGGSITSGTWLVNSQITPGRYVATSAASGCYWERLRGLSGLLADTIANDFAGAGQQLVDIAPTDLAFKTSGCGTWSRVS